MNSASGAQEQGPLHTFMSVINSAQSIWKKLNETFSHVDGHKIYQILRDLYTLKQGTDSVDFYYNKLQGLWDELAAIEPQETCNCGSCICGASSRQEEQNQRRQLIQFLMGLNDRYSTVRRQILMMQPLPSVAQAFAIVRQDERQRRGYVPGTNHSTALLTKSFSASNDSNNMVVDNESTALMANSQNRDQFQFEGPKANLWCTYCHKQGHTKDICFKLVGYPTTHSASRWNKAESSFNQFPTSTPKTNSNQKFNSNVPVIANKPGGSANTGAANMTTTEPGNLSDSIQQLLPQVQQLFSMVRQSQSHSSLEDPEEHLADETCTNKDLKTLKILSYNVWFREDLEMHKRMKALGDLIQMHSPDLICLQEVTPNIYDIFQQSSWWKFYKCSVSNEMAFIRPYFCMQLSKMPVKLFSCKPFRNSIMKRELCVAEVVSEEDKQLVIATSHLESPCPGPPKWDQMYSKERVDQAKEAINILKQHNNVIFCGDMNWDDELDGQFPIPKGWIDAWTELRPRELGYTYDTKTNKMLSGNRALQKRLDRFLCCLSDFKIDQIEMIGMEAIPGLSYCKEKKVKKEVKNMILPVLPSDHYGLLLTIRSQ